MARDRDRQALRETQRFGVVDPEVAKEAENKRRNLRARNERNFNNRRVQPESSTPGRSNPPVTEEERNRVIDDSLEAAHRRGFSQTRSFDDGGSAEISFSRDALLNRLDEGSAGLRKGRLSGFENPGQATPNVTTIPSESFTNPAFTGFNSGKNIARAVKKDFEREQRQKAIDSDMEFRRNLRQRQLFDDANLRLGGDMTLTELADRAGRRRSARQALREQDVTAAERATSQATSQAALAQTRQLEVMKERGRNLRERAGLSSEQAEREAERADNTLELNATSLIRDNNGNLVDVHDPQLEARTRQIVASSGKLPGQMNDAELTKATNTAKTIRNIENATGNSIENFGELRDIIGFKSEDILSPFFDTTDLIFVNERGQEVNRANLNDVIQGDNAVRRQIDEIISDKVRHGEIQVRVSSPLSFLGQEADTDFNIENDPEAAAERIKAEQEAEQERKQGLHRRDLAQAQAFR